MDYEKADRLAACSTVVRSKPSAQIFKVNNSLRADHVDRCLRLGMFVQLEFNGKHRGCDRQWPEDNVAGS
jgi:hypothetical protein